LFKEWQYDGENARMMVGHQQSDPAGPFRAIVRFCTKRTSPSCR
jgi:hypothetical protein